MTNNASGLDKFFKLTEHKTNVRTEIVAGITTFLTMAYILAVNPNILSAPGFITGNPALGLDPGAVFTASAIAAVVATLIMGIFANLPFALAPGMGANAFFAFTVVLGMGFSPQMALTAVFVEGIIFLFLTFFKVREAIINSIPLNLKKAISVGIGLFITFIGLVDAKVVNFAAGVPTPDIFSYTTGFANGPAITCLLGVVIAGILLVKNVKGALFIAIIAATLIGIPLGVTDLSKLSSGIVAMPAAPNMFDFVSWNEVLSFQFFVVLFTFLFLNLFDTVGTLVGVCTKAGLLTEKGEVPNATQALFADAFGTTLSACMGCSPVATYVESAAGVAEGGRTGLTAVVTAVMFAIALFLSPLFLMIPASATAVALIMVGFFMMEPVTSIEFGDFTEGIPAFLAIVIMPFTYSVAEGIVFGIVSYTILKFVTGRSKEVQPITIVLSVLFIFKELSPYLFRFFK